MKIITFFWKCSCSWHLTILNFIFMIRRPYFHAIKNEIKKNKKFWGRVYISEGDFIILNCISKKSKKKYKFGCMNKNIWIWNMKREAWSMNSGTVNAEHKPLKCVVILYLKFFFNDKIISSPSPTQFWQFLFFWSLVLTFLNASMY